MTRYVSYLHTSFHDIVPPGWQGLTYQRLDFNSGSQLGLDIRAGLRASQSALNQDASLSYNTSSIPDGRSGSLIYWDINDFTYSSSEDHHWTSGLRQLGNYNTPTIYQPFSSASASDVMRPWFGISDVFDGTQTQYGLSVQDAMRYYGDASASDVGQWAGNSADSADVDATLYNAATTAVTTVISMSGVYDHLDSSSAVALNTSMATVQMNNELQFVYWDTSPVYLISASIIPTQLFEEAITVREYASISWSLANSSSEDASIYYKVTVWCSGSGLTAPNGREPGFWIHESESGVFYHDITGSTPLGFDGAATIGGPSGSSLSYNSTGSEWRCKVAVVRRDDNALIHWKEVYAPGTPCPTKTRILSVSNTANDRACPQGDYFEGSASLSQALGADETVEWWSSGNGTVWDIGPIFMDTLTYERSTNCGTAASFACNENGAFRARIVNALSHEPCGPFVESSLESTTGEDCV